MVKLLGLEKEMISSRPNVSFVMEIICFNYKIFQKNNKWLNNNLYNLRAATNFPSGPTQTSKYIGAI